ncbi:uncharacterized protein DUF4919 [Chryseobacterium daecheongense]|uniref:Uncharacterized protein DUF4919 n=2 Tax=Chryseobacterium daecheongense TaxID=192389 RepID=A0ABY2FRQ1_9FLAO|nr:DUF4919 domain-containing protein [Chryseobacterium daecheongense]TDX90273.1 uncharacterized protein DUF4919 [Chryseobacterium daecheongense]
MTTTMNTRLFAFIAFIMLIPLSAQESNPKAPDYQLIKKNIENKNSEFYYPKLLKKLKENDTLITKEQYQHLYFGYTFQKEYNPYKKSKNDEKLNQYYRGENITEKDVPKVIRALKEALEENPLDLRAMNYLAYMHHMSNDESMAKKISRNFHGLFEAITSSGDGMKCESAMHVISVSHEYVFLNMFQLEIISQSYNGTCDYLQFEKDKYKVPGIYFNVSQLREKSMELLKSKFDK